jgi:RIMS-binding protein 2
MGPVPNKKNVPVPDPPHHLHVKGIVNEKSILLSWLPPPMDAQGNSNGLKVLGYMVYLDNAEYEPLSNPGQCEVVVEGLSPDRCHRLAVQSLCAEGYVSPRAELVFEGMVKLGQSQVEGQGQMDTDLSSVLNSAQYKRGHKRRVMALYDYSPEQQSPHDYTALELPFHAGDLIYVYGEPRQDGFYHGEIDEKRGLVPACFVEDIAKLNRTQDKHKAPGYKSS